jgi:thioredoxin-related protein
VLDDKDVSSNLFGVRYTPTTLMLDRTGQIIFSSIGYAPGNEKTLAAEIEYLLKSS